MNERLLALLALSPLIEAAIALEEGKAVHGHAHVANPGTAHRRKRAADAGKAARQDIEGWRDAKRNKHSAAMRQYDAVKAKFGRALRAAVFGFMRGEHNKKALLSDAKDAFTEAYAAAYRLGLKSAGVGALDVASKASKQGPSVDAHDREWIDSAIAEEEKYWKGFVRDLTSGAIHGKRMSPEQRVQMYVDTLDAVFDAGRVVGHPSHTIFYWIMNPEKEHCEICLFLQKNSPYTRDTLPGTPRDGHTCFGLSRCGCELRAVTFDNTERWNAVRKSKSRETLLKAMKALRAKR